MTNQSCPLPGGTVVFGLSAAGRRVRETRAEGVYGPRFRTRHPAGRRAFSCVLQTTMPAYQKYAIDPMQIGIP
jgi:hypothetical protein